MSIEGTKKIMSCLKKNKTKPKENKIEVSINKIFIIEIFCRVNMKFRELQFMHF